MNIFFSLLMNWDSVLLVLALVTALIVLYVRGYKKLLNYILYTAVTEVEKQYGSGTGVLKKAAVISKIYSILPMILKIIISEDQIGRWIEDALTYAKKTWAENAAIGDYIKQEDTAEIADDKLPDTVVEPIMPTANK